MISAAMNEALYQVKRYQRVFPHACDPHTNALRTVKVILQAARLILDIPPAESPNDPAAEKVAALSHALATVDLKAVEEAMRLARTLDAWASHVDQPEGGRA